MDGMMNKKRFILIIIIITLGLFLWINKKNYIPEQTPQAGRFLFLPYIITPAQTIKPVTQATLDVNKVEDIPCLFFQALEEAYLYFLLITSGKKIKFIFPGSDGKFPEDYYLKDYSLPEENGWGKHFKQKGKYTLYIIVSRKQPERIRKLLSKYNNRTNKKNTGPETATELQAEIRRYQKKIDWNQNLHKRPDLFSGTIRSDESVFNYAWPISFNDLFIYQIDINYLNDEIYE